MSKLKKATAASQEASLMSGKKHIGELSISEISALESRLGKESDAAIGRDYGYSRERIRQIRHSIGIPAYSLGKKMAYPVPCHFTAADAKDMGRAMKKTGQKNRSEYIRGAVRDKNKEVLEK